MSSERDGARAASPEPAGDDRPPESPMRALARGTDQASVMSVELLAGIGTWMGIGWLADRWLGTDPWLMVIGALVGNAAGIYLIWLRSGRTPSAQPEGTPAGADRDAAAREARDG